METNDTNGGHEMNIGDTTYFYGDAATVTTEPFELYGGVFVDAVLTEGHRAGETVTVKYKC